MQDKFITERGHAFVTSWEKAQEHFSLKDLSDPEYSYELIKKATQEKENIIREAATQGFKYLLYKYETVMDGYTATMKSKYKGINDLELEDIGMYESAGVEVLELDKVREYISKEITK